MLLVLLFCATFVMLACSLPAQEGWPFGVGFGSALSCAALRAEQSQAAGEWIRAACRPVAAGCDDALCCTCPVVHARQCGAEAACAARAERARGSHPPR